ncbi:hypothetical protein B0H16DRAFT_1599805 [Mycena metata]|uniref:Uncharacterized protein n=1 Tax=Mycena metata TaxID=1033252 RepID=A0AAD7HL42_9AGAR|nr:hypothetical protein B0H16DRAFT_1599805 [Mycena metata]
MRPSSSASVISDTGSAATQNSAEFEPVKGKQSISKEDKAALRTRLIGWREQRHFEMGNSPYLPPECVLPPKQLEKLVAAAGTFLKHALVEPKHVRKAVTWELAAETDITQVCGVISGWRLTLNISRTPPSERRQGKQPRTFMAPIAQPVFSPMPPRPSRQPLATPGPSTRGRRPAHGLSPNRTASTRQNIPPLSAPTSLYSPADNPFSRTPTAYDGFFSTYRRPSSTYSTPQNTPHTHR